MSNPYITSAQELAAFIRSSDNTLKSRPIWGVSGLSIIKEGARWSFHFKHAGRRYHICRKNLPDLPIAHAVALCYRIAAVEVPRTKGFELPPLSIEETVPTQDPVCIPTIMAEVKTYISKYVVSPPEVINLLAYYAASTKVESQRTRQPSKRHGRKSLSAFLLPKQQEKLG